MTSVLRLRLGETVVGELRLVAEKTTFIPDDHWATDGRRPVLGQRFEDDPFRRFGTPGRLPRWFGNLLPEGPLRDLIARSNGYSTNQEFQLLRAIGEDLPGGLIVELADGDSVQAAAGAEDAELYDRNDDDLPPLKFSLAGVQLKFSAVASADEKGLVIPTAGVDGRWIVKLPDLRHPRVPANEFSMLTWCAASGMQVPRIRLMATDEIAGMDSRWLSGTDEREVFAIQRFDRVGEHRVHMEDFAQVVGVWPDEKYNHASYGTLLGIVDAVTEGRDTEEFIRRLVMVVATGNGDAHLKNWTIIYPDGREARLSPAYDYVCTLADYPNDPLALTLGGERLAEDIDARRFASLIDRADRTTGGLRMNPRRLREVVSETVAAAQGAWAMLRPDLPCDERIKTQVDGRLRTPLFRG
jgi:serine/threonine-protein kinase HipA